MLFFCKHVQLYTWGVTSPQSSPCHLPCIWLHRNGWRWTCLGCPGGTSSEIRWGPVKSWRNVGLSEVTSCYLGVSSLGIGRVQTLERQQAGVKWWNWWCRVALDPGEKTRIPGKWYPMICIESWQLSRNYPQMVLFFRWYVNTFLRLYIL